MLDASDLQDDFYSNLVDWSSRNVLAVGLGSYIYLLNDSSKKVRFQFFPLFFVRKFQFDPLLLLLYYYYCGDIWMHYRLQSG